MLASIHLILKANSFIRAISTPSQQDKKERPQTSIRIKMISKFLLHSIPCDTNHRNNLKNHDNISEYYVVHYPIIRSLTDKRYRNSQFVLKTRCSHRCSQSVFASFTHGPVSLLVVIHTRLPWGTRVAPHTNRFTIPYSRIAFLSRPDERHRNVDIVAR